jgi:hypothetical protein
MLVLKNLPSENLILFSKLNVRLHVIKCKFTYYRLRKLCVGQLNRLVVAAVRIEGVLHILEPML